MSEGTTKERMKIHIVSTVNGQINEGMRNIATHISKEFEKNNVVKYSRLKSIWSIIKNSKTCDVTMVFARANKRVYWLARLVCLFSKNTWIVCVQKPDSKFESATRKHPLKANYLAIVERDLDEITIREKYRKELFGVGINTVKFVPVDTNRQKELKKKYDLDPNTNLVVHVGHCSPGRGLEDFAEICSSERLIVASGMFESEETVEALETAGVRILKGYQEHVEEIYQMADVYLFPTHSTEFVISIPLSVMEALSCGVPVIGYKDFENLSEILSEEGSIVTITDRSQLDETVQLAATKKQGKSLLLAPKAWSQVADEVLRTVRQ